MSDHAVHIAVPVELLRFLVEMAEIGMDSGWVEEQPSDGDMLIDAKALLPLEPDE